VKRADHVEQAILALLAEEGLGPGDRLPAERDLVARTEASRPAVREAIVRLCREGLLVSRQGSGTYVAPVDIGAISAVRALLEPAAAAAAATARTERQARDLEAALRRMSDSAEDPAAFAAADAAIHRTVAEACGNPVLEDAIARLARRAAVSRAATSPHAGVRAQALADVRELVTAIAQRRPADARAAMERHLEHLSSAAPSRSRSRP
jgi:GntR family transcriptional repressor for pyruvate dehydrogenase complex